MPEDHEKRKPLVMKYMKKLCLTAFLAGIIFLLPACNASSTLEDELQVYLATQIAAESEIGAVLSLYRNSGMLYLLSNQDSELQLISMDMNYTIMQSWELENSNKVAGFSVAGNGAIQLAAIEEDGSIIIDWLEPDGSNSNSVKLSASSHETAQSMNISGMAADSSGTTYIAWYEGSGKSFVTALSSTGDVLYTLECGGQIYSIIVAGEDTACVLLDGAAIKTIDSENKAWGETYELGGNYSRLYAGLENDVYLDNGTVLYRYSFDAGGVTGVLRWSGTGLSAGAICLAVVDKDQMIVSTGEGLYLLQQEAAPETTDTRKVITIASESTYSIMSEVREFNAANSEYKIEVIELSPDDATRHMTELMAGNVPDIYHFIENNQVFSAQDLARQGYLADLYLYIDNDSELSRDAFLPNILLAAESGGKLYELPNSFAVKVAAGDSAVLGSSPGWTFQDMMTILESREFTGYLMGPNIDKSSLLYWLLEYNADEFIDWDSGACTFDSDAFVRLLEAVNQYAPAESEKSTTPEPIFIAEGQLLLLELPIARICSVQYFDYYFEDAVLIGFPTSSGVGNSILYHNSFAISADTEYGDAAWEFIRQYYTPDYFENHRQSMHFPINAEAMESKFQSPQEENYTITYSSEVDSYSIRISDPTDYDIERTRELISSLDRVSRGDLSLYAIVAEEAQYYFNGVKTAEEVVIIIQSRAQIYISEQTE